jgi:hypothetical protein
MSGKRHWQGRLSTQRSVIGERAVDPTLSFDGDPPNGWCRPNPVIRERQN